MMNSELRKRMGEFSERLHPDVIDGFELGAEWMHANEVVPRDELIDSILLYSRHSQNCGIYCSFTLICSCGYAELRSKIEAIQKGGEG